MPALTHLTPIAASSAAPLTGLSPPGTLTLLLTTESLLFAAFGVGVALTTPTAEGRPAFIAQGYLALGVALVILVVGIGAFTAFLEILDWGRLRGFSSIAQATAIAVGIAMQPVFALVVGVKLAFS
ncbi:MAG TPA: hypothetical protein VGV57_08010 [Thermoleophilaceae bacterium]|nr:hypothetical protein [Thermoleophilaceae bacterium]